MALTNKTKYALLGALSLYPMSGYEFKKFSDFSIAHFWSEHYARIYPVLKEMEKEELVTSETQYTPGKPPKNVYSITEKGLQELHEWLLQPVEQRPLREELLLKLFFSADIPVENSIEKLKVEREKYKKMIAEYHRIESIITSEEPFKNHPGLPLWLSTLSYGKYYCEGIIKWCNETIEVLETKK